MHTQEYSWILLLLLLLLLPLHTACTCFRMLRFCKLLGRHHLRRSVPVQVRLWFLSSMNSNLSSDIIKKLGVSHSITTFASPCLCLCNACTDQIDTSSPTPWFSLIATTCTKDILDNKNSHCLTWKASTAFRLVCVISMTWQATAMAGIPLPFG